MERHNAYSPSPQLKASLKFTHTPRTDPVRSGAIFRQEAQSEEGGHQQQTNLHQIAFSKGEDFHGGSEQRVQQSGKDGVQINSAAVHSRAPALSASSSALIAPASLPQHSFAPRNTAQSPVADSSAIIRPAPYGRLVPQPSPTPFGVAAWASSVGQQISANFDALVRQSPAPRVLREHAQSPPYFHTPSGPMHEAFSGPQRSGGSDASRLMPPPRQSPRHAPKQEVQRQAALAQPNRGVPSASLSYEEKGGADFSGRPGLRPSPKAQGTNGSESANGVAERPAALSPAASGSGVREPGLAVPVKQGVLGAGSRSDGGSGSRTPVEEGPLSPAFGHQAKQVDLNHSEPVPSASAVDPGKSPILYLGFETPVSLQPGSVLRSHSEQKKGAPSETKARTSNASDHETFFTPDNTNAGATPFTRSRLKAAQSPAKTPPQARAENTPQSHAKQATRAQESKLLGSTGRNMRGSSVKQPARGLSAFLEDEGDEGDPAFSLEFPLPEDEPPGPVAEEALGGGLMPEVPAGGGGAEERNVEAEGGSLKEVGRENGLGDGAKEDSERTESDRPKRDGLNGEADEAGEVNSAGAVLPSTPKGTGKASKGDRKSAGKTPKSRPKRHVDPQEEPLATEGLAEQEEPLATEGLAERSNRVRRSSRGVQDSGVASPTVSKTKGTETAAPKPSPKRANLGSTQKPPEAVESAKTGTPKSPQQRKGADKTTETSAVTPRSVDRAERLAKRRKLSGGRMKEIEEKEIEPGVGLGTERGGAGKKMEEGASGADVVPKEEADVKRMSESKKRSRILRELESRLKGPEDDVIVTRGAKLPEAAQVSRRGRLVAPKLAFWENEYYDRDKAGRIIGISRPPEHITPSKKPQTPKPFSPKREPVVKSENAEKATDGAQRKQKPGTGKEATPSKREVKVEGDVSTSQSRGEKRKGEGGGKARGDADRLVKQEAVNGAPKSPGGSPGRWVSTRNKRKRLEEEDTKNQEKKTKRSTKTNQSGDRKDERRPSKKRKGASKGDGSKGSEVSGSVGGLKPSGSVSGPQPSDPSGRRKSSDQLWRLKRQHKVAKGPRAANFVGDGFVAGTVENEGGKNEKDEERDEEREREDGTEGAAAAVDGDMRENDGGREDALEIGGSKGGESEEQKSGGDASKDVSRADRRLRSRGKEIVQDREEEKYLKGGSRRKRGKEEGPVAGLADDMQQGKKRNGKLQGPVEDLRRRKKERRIDDLLVEDKSGTAGEESTETERKKLKKGREAKSGASKSETAPSEGGRKAPKSKTATDDERGANGASALGGDDVRKKGRVKEGDIIHREEASGPKVARYPRRRLRKKGELEHGVSGDNGAKEGGAEEKGGSGDGSNPTEAVDTLREDQRVTAVFENQGEEGAKPSDDAAEPSKEADAEEKRGDIDELAEGRGDEAAVVNASQEEGAEVDGEAATALGAGLNAEESGLVDKKEAPEESNRGADEAAEQLGMGIAGNDVARASVKKGAASIGEENGREASPEPNSEKVRAGLEAEQKTGGAKGSVADAQQGHVSEGQLGNVAEVGVVEERTILMGLVQTAEAGVGVASGEGPVYTEGKGPIHTSSAEALPTDDVPTGSLQSAIAKSAVPIPTGAAEPVATGGAGPVHNDGAGPVHTATEDELVDATGWTASQVAALKSALRMIDPTVDGLWYKVARQVPGKNHIECQTKHNEAYATPPVRPPHARRAGMSPAPRIILQGAGRGLANQSKPRGTIVSVQMQGMRAAREILRAQQAKQRAEAGDPLAFHVAESHGTAPNDAGPAHDSVSTPVASPLILKPVPNQDKYIDDALQRRLQAQRWKNATSQGGSGAQTLKAAPPVLGFEGVTRETVVGAAAGVVAAAEKARVLREQAVTSMEDEPEAIAGGDREEEEEEDDPPPFA